MQIDYEGSPKLTNLEAGALIYEMARRDPGIAGFFVIHNGIGMAVIDAFGSKSQKQKFLPPYLKFDKVLGFGLTEPLNGSDASQLQTTARRVPGGWVLNGQKRWIGNATLGDVVVWAKNMEDGGKVQAFVVEKGMKGFTPTKMQGKMAFRAV